MTDDPDIRFASSLVDYIFRRMAVEYMDADKREALGIRTVGERLQQTLPGVDEAATPVAPSMDLPAGGSGAVGDVRDAGRGPGAGSGHSGGAGQGDEREVVLCHVCGDIMQRAGSCHACPSCGSTSGCS